MNVLMPSEVSTVSEDQSVEALRRELAEAREQQTATSALLKVIGGSTLDLQPVFEALAENAIRLCEAEHAFIYRFDGQVLRVVATHNVSAERRAFAENHPIAPGRHSAAARAALERRTIHIHDVQADPDYQADPTPTRTVLGIPMLRANDLLGVIIIYQFEIRPFTNSQIALMETFADQAVIAIENTRLFEEVRARTKDLSESLEQQTATSEILQVISNSLNDTQPVFDAIVQSGLKLFPGALVSVALRYGAAINAAAVAAPDPALVEAWRRTISRTPLARNYMHGAALLDCRIVDIPDVADAPAEFAAGSQNFLTSGNRAITIMPMTRGDEAIGLLSVVRLVPGPLSDEQLAVLRTFANQAVIAIENTRLLNELRES